MARMIMRRKLYPHQREQDMKNIRVLRTDVANVLPLNHHLSNLHTTAHLVDLSHTYGGNVDMYLPERGNHSINVGAGEGKKNPDMTFIKRHIKEVVGTTRNESIGNTFDMKGKLEGWKAGIVEKLLKKLDSEKKDSNLKDEVRSTIKMLVTRPSEKAGYETAAERQRHRMACNSMQPRSSEKGERNLGWSSREKRIHVNLLDPVKHVLLLYLCCT